MVKAASSGGVNFDWIINDTMRGLLTPDNAGRSLFANSAAAEFSQSTVSILSNGFTPIGASSNSNQSGVTYIYIAIRRGPMKVPTTGTSVFNPVTYTGDATSTRTISAANRTDLLFTANRNNFGFAFYDRLRGNGAVLYPSTTGAENSTDAGRARFDINTGYYFTSRDGYNNDNSQPYIAEFFTRAPGFFDEVCYTGTGSSQNVAHNLAAVPELLIIKRRNSTGGWEAAVPSTTAGSFFVGTSGAPISLNTTNGNGGQAAYAWASNTGTSTYFNPEGIFWNGNTSGATFVAYLFATCPGVSKVGSYTGNGSSQTINCGFTGGARFVMIKRTDNTGDWYVWDTARGIVSGNDPHLSLNTTAAEVTTDDTIDTDSTGFVVNQVSATNVNVSSATYIFLAIA
jgi:hypothetical protein